MVKVKRGVSQRIPLARASKLVACNNGAGGHTQRDMKLLTYLTDPQGIIKK